MGFVEGKKLKNFSRAVELTGIGINADIFFFLTVAKSDLNTGIQPYLVDVGAQLTSLAVSCDLMSFPSAPIPSPGLASSSEALQMAADSQWGCHNLLMNLYQRSSLTDKWNWIATASLTKNALFGWQGLNLLSLISGDPTLTLQEEAQLGFNFQLTNKDIFITLPSPTYTQQINGDWESKWEINLPTPGQWEFKKLRAIDGTALSIQPKSIAVNNTTNKCSIAIESSEGKVGGYKIIANFKSLNELRTPNAATDRITLKGAYELKYSANIPDAPPVPVLVQGTVQQVMQYSETKSVTSIGTTVKKALASLRTNRLSGNVVNSGTTILTLYWGDAATSNITLAAGGTYYFPSNQVEGLSATSSAFNGSCSVNEVWRA